MSKEPTWLDELDKHERERHQKVRGAVIKMSQLLRIHARELIDAAKQLRQIDSDGGVWQSPGAIHCDCKRLREENEQLRWPGGRG